MAVFNHEIVIVGAGLAGLRAAVEAAEYCDVAVISKTASFAVSFRSCTRWYLRRAWQ
ncbi:MAG: FAD-binding protein [Chloroherpetonaceae bacterium]|nr:FAD-binding protein [Chloroherpetonaceae bacterium]